MSAQNLRCIKDKQKNFKKINNLSGCNQNERKIIPDFFEPTPAMNEGNEIISMHPWCFGIWSWYKLYEARQIDLKIYKIPFY